MPERRAQVVRDGVRERRELLVGAVELSGAFGDAPFELLVQVPARQLGKLSCGDVHGHPGHSRRIALGAAGDL